MRSIRRVLERLGTLAAALLLASCAPGDGRAPCPKGQACVEIGNGSDPGTLDPARAQLTTESHILYDLLIGLTTLDADGRTVPGMATDWTTSPDGLLWTFHLRAADWSDGVPVTADDFVFAWRRLEDPRTAAVYAYLLDPIAGAAAVNAGKAPPAALGVRALDPHTLQIRLAHPAPYLPLLLVHPSAMPVPAHVVRRWGDAWVQPGHYVSNGPYRLVEWTLGDRIVLARNPRFRDGRRICFDQVRYHPTSDPISAERRVANGELDAMTDFASNRAAFLRARHPGFVRTNPLLATYYLALNRRVPQLRDRRVRLALSIAADRGFLADTLLRAGQAPLYGFVPPGMSGYPGLPAPRWAGWSIARRQAVARALLARAGFGPTHPLRLELKYPSGGDAIVAPALQADWRAIGADILLSPEEGQIFYADMRARAFEIGYASWYADFADPLSFLQLFTGGTAPQNYGGYRDVRYDALMRRADHESDARRRARLLAAAEALAIGDVAVAPLYTGSAHSLVSPTLAGWRDSRTGWHPKRFLCRR